MQDLGNEDIKPTFHMYLLQIDPAKAAGDIQVLKKKLEEKGVTQIAHFGPLYRFKIVQEMGYDSNEIAKTCPNCEEVFYKRFTHLPLYGLFDEQLTYMADAVLGEDEIPVTAEDAISSQKAIEEVYKLNGYV